MLIHDVPFFPDSLAMLVATSEKIDTAGVNTRIDVIQNNSGHNTISALTTTQKSECR